MLSDAWRIAVKDLTIELRTRLLLAQVAPFSLIVLILFGFAVSPDLLVESEAARSLITQVAPGLFWVTILFVCLFTINRSFSIEARNGAMTSLKLSAVDASAIYLGKVLAAVFQLFVLQVFLGTVAFALYRLPLADFGMLFVTAIAASVALAAIGVLYGAVSFGSQTPETLNALLLLPAVSPVMLAATRSSEIATFGENSVAWGWALLLIGMAAFYISVGVLMFESLLEDS